jgi:hypothetical protein
MLEALHGVIPEHGRKAGPGPFEHLQEHVIMRKQNQLIPPQRGRLGLTTARSAAGREKKPLPADRRATGWVLRTRPVNL